MNGHLVSGTRIAESKLSKEFRAGQPSVREALFILERQGLVRRRANLGTFVTELDIRDVANLHRIRVELEALAAAQATRHIRDADFEELYSLLDQMQSASETGNKWLYMKSDLAFHRKIWQVSGNSRLSEILEGVVVPLMVFGFMKVVRLAGFDEYARKAHGSLIEALRIGPEKAREVVHANLERSLKNYLDSSL